MSPTSSSDAQGWQELTTTSRRQCPKLFYQFSTHEESLNLLLTDLIGIWETKLDRFDILAAAARQHTSIDPSVSPKQLDVLLSKLGTSLTSGENAITRGAERNSHTLSLHTKSDLPRPLRPLEWTFTLDPQPTSELAERVLRPSLHKVAVSQTKINSLLGTIKEKDHVISRLLDRIGNSAVDLSLVFPGIAGFASRKGGHVSVADAKKHVPGMASFQESVWTKQFANEGGYEGADRTGLGNLVRGCEKCFVHSKDEHESWVRDLPITNETRHDSKGDKQNDYPAEASAGQKSDADGGSTEDEFERQATPPTLKSKKSPTKDLTKALAMKELETDDEDSPPAKRPKLSNVGGLAHHESFKDFSKRSLQKPFVRASKAQPPAPQPSGASTASSNTSEDQAEKPPSSTRSTRSPAPKGTSKLGKLNKNKPPAVRSPSATPTPTPSPEPARNTRLHGSPPHSTRQPQSSPTIDISDEGEESENESLGRASAPAPKSQPKSKSKTSTPTKRLGHLGGTKKTSPAPPPTSTTLKSTDEDDDDEAIEAASPPKRKLGKLGGLRNKTKESTSSTSPKIAHGTKANTKSNVHDDESDATKSPSSSPSPQVTKRSTPKNSNATTDPATTNTTASPSPSKKVTAKEPPTEETAEEAATRRRMELKRTIETGGGRKKRRF